MRAGYSCAGHAAHVVTVFPGDAGWTQARAFQARLLGGPARLFAARTFGSVYMLSVSAPFLVRAVLCFSCGGRAAHR